MQIGFELTKDVTVLGPLIGSLLIYKENAYAVLFGGRYSNLLKDVVEFNDRILTDKIMLLM